MMAVLTLGPIKVNILASIEAKTITLICNGQQIVLFNALK